ncbi:tRNA pseudouridine(55) synthase TruB [Lachnospiraceae bacterium OttesenSCG-928-E19]|nr:tRNA pseudouridine(55) synthase TruB [Lachnospiraceae bacterium OttesenSCG-928-E19]
MENSGWIILDKPENMTSRRAGHILFKMFNSSTYGHIGTLDPMASGLLPIALGAATKMVPFWVDDQVKEYLFSVQFGYETDTLDVCGTETLRTDITPTDDKIVNACKQLIGNIDQIPPMYSAIHVNGMRAYELARAGKNIEMKPRPVKIYELEFMGFRNSAHQFRVLCSPGTYVRSIGRDIAKMCGTLGTVNMIRRIQSNGLTIKDTVKLDFLENLYNNGSDFKKYLKDVDFGLGDIPVLNLNDKDAQLFMHGGFVTICDMKHETCDMNLQRVYSDNKFIGIGFVENGMLKPKRVLS